MRHSYNFIDMTGQRFGRLVVKELAEPHIDNNGNRRIRWLCVCDCGNETLAYRQNLLSGAKTSCGCRQDEVRKVENRKYNRYEIDGNICFVKFTNSDEKFLIDAHNVDLIKEYCWVKANTGYAVAKNIHGDGLVYLHRLLVGTIPDGMVVDHIDGNKLNNTIQNLRICRQFDNMQNVKSNMVDNTTAGVSYVDRLKKNPWRAQITYNGKHIHLGYFPTKEDAIKARRDAERKYRGC